MLAFYQTLSALRHDNSALRKGEMITLLTDDDKGVYAFVRVDKTAGNAALVVVNKSSEDQTVNLLFGAYMPTFLTLMPVFGGDSISTGVMATVTIPALSGNIWTTSRHASFKAPKPPANVAAQGVYGGVVLTWDPVPGVSKYVIFRGPVAVGGFEWSGISAGPSELMIDDTTSNGYKYYYAVASLSDDGVIGEMSASVPAIPCAPISSTSYLMDDAPQSHWLMV
jgi:hypothetical protein